VNIEDAQKKAGTPLEQLKRALDALPLNEVFTNEELAERLGLNPSTLSWRLYRLRDYSVKVGKSRWYGRPEALKAFLED